MKTDEEFYTEITGSATLQSELKAIKGRYALERFLKNHDCGVTAEFFAKYVKSQSEGEIADDEAESAAGGGFTVYEPLTFDEHKPIEPRRKR